METVAVVLFGLRPSSRAATYRVSPFSPERVYSRSASPLLPEKTSDETVEVLVPKLFCEQLRVALCHAWYKEEPRCTFSALSAVSAPAFSEKWSAVCFSLPKLSQLRGTRQVSQTPSRAIHVFYTAGPSLLR